MSPDDLYKDHKENESKTRGTNKNEESIDLENLRNILSYEKVPDGKCAYNGIREDQDGKHQVPP